MRTTVWIGIAVLFLNCSQSTMVAPIGVMKESHLSIQKIIKVMPGYVLIDSGVGIKEISRPVNVYRMRSQFMRSVGMVELVEYIDEKVVAKIVEENTRSKIRAGDFIYLPYKSHEELNVREYIKFLEDENGRKRKSISN